MADNPQPSTSTPATPMSRDDQLAQMSLQMGQMMLFMQQQLTQTPPTVPVVAPSPVEQSVLNDW